MAPTDEDEFIASDAFGDFFFFGQANSAPTQSECQRSPSCTGVFTFPVRSRATSSNKQLHSASPAKASYSLIVDATADATATLVLLAPKQEVDRDRELGKDTNGVKPAIASRIGAKLDSLSGERGYERPTSLDTANLHCNRDQCTADAPSPSSMGDGTKAVCLSSLLENPCLHSQHMAARRSGSMGGSGGGAGPGAAHHHGGFWQSTEWWRSFSSSRLNEIGMEEPDQRSSEMRKVPYVGGAEPMCVLMHGEEERGPK